MDDTFAFIIHPIDPKRDVSRKYPLLGKILTEGQINFFSRFFPPVYISAITGVQSVSSGKTIKGWFIAAPYTPTTMLSLREQTVYRKIVACGHMAEELGARLLGLGAYTSVVGDAGATIARQLDIPVTNGDAYTVYMAIEAVREAARRMDIDMAQASASVVGATGVIGKVCSQILAREVPELMLVGRRPGALADIREQCTGYRARVQTSQDISSIYDSDLILTVTSATTSIIEPQHLRPGAVVCDVARPRDVSVRVAEVRDDVLVIEGGMGEVPGPVDFGFNFGFPPGKAYACMAETMALALEGRYEDYSVGKHISLEQVEEIGEICTRHGFGLSGFRSFERAVTDEHIAHVRQRALETRWARRTPPVPVR
ncbi:MAG: shikimate dehydrogenase [Chloroflexi bacterium]|nr:shikimate dehydrogenase [Chloroflexota bacterium]